MHPMIKQEPFNLVFIQWEEYIRLQLKMSVMNRSGVSDKGGRVAIQQPKKKMTLPFPVPPPRFPIEEKL